MKAEEIYDTNQGLWTNKGRLALVCSCHILTQEMKIQKHFKHKLPLTTTQFVLLIHKLNTELHLITESFVL